MALDNLFSPASINMDIDLGFTDTTASEGLTYPGMDPNISDSESD